MSEWSIDLARSIEEVSAGSPILFIGSAPAGIVGLMTTQEVTSILFNDVSTENIENSSSARNQECLAKYFTNLHPVVV